MSKVTNILNKGSNHLKKLEFDRFRKKKKMALFFENHHVKGGDLVTLQQSDPIETGISAWFRVYLILVTLHRQLPIWHR